MSALWLVILSPNKRLLAHTHFTSLPISGREAGIHCQQRQSSSDGPVRPIKGRSNFLRLNGFFLDWPDGPVLDQSRHRRCSVHVSITEDLPHLLYTIAL